MLTPHLSGGTFVGGDGVTYRWQLRKRILQVCMVFSFIASD